MAHPPTQRDNEYNQMRVILHQFVIAYKTSDDELMRAMAGRADRMLTSIWESRQEEAKK